ncbi:hypothetical protein MICRO8M_80393 [Microbacterium sp. 8M]|nr:hypothetical protein MICRO8M_80393 [Microbacterium sp. 8M]
MERRRLRMLDPEPRTHRAESRCDGLREAGHGRRLRGGGPEHGPRRVRADVAQELELGAVRRHLAVVAPDRVGVRVGRGAVGLLQRRALRGRIRGVQRRHVRKQRLVHRHGAVHRGCGLGRPHGPRHPEGHHRLLNQGGE